MKTCIEITFGEKKKQYPCSYLIYSYNQYDAMDTNKKDWAVVRVDSEKNLSYRKYFV